MSKRNRRKIVQEKLQTPFSRNDEVVSIVIPVYNRFDILADCLSAIPQAIQNFKYSIVIYDNGSDKDEADKFYKELPTTHPDLNIMIGRNTTNSGFPRACNVAASRKQSPLIFFLNSDVILDPHSLDYLVTRMDDPQIGVCGMKLVFPMNCKDLNPQIRPAGKVQHIGLSVNVQGKIHHLYIGWNEDNPKVNMLSDMFAVTGAAMMVRRSLWSKVGGFNEVYGLGTLEDVQLCQDIRSLGYRVVVVPEARGVHYTGATAEKYKMGYPINQNMLIFMQRCGGRLDWWDGRIL